MALQLEDLAVGYPGRPPLVEHLNLELGLGEAVAILGPSGHGKSTLLKTIAGLLPLAGGNMTVLGHPNPDRPPKGSIGYVPQRLGLVRHTSVLDNVQHGALHLATKWQNLLHRAPPGATERAWDALRAVGLEDKADDPILQLSGGQQRRVAVARTLVQRPRLLLADEFLGELDPATASTVAGAVRSLQESEGTAVLLVEHQLDQARRVADRVFRLADGRLEEA
ncbi:MAG: ATP-binding cassette domain-containing protein [Thermoplasmatota archaeon]